MPVVFRTIIYVIDEQEMVRGRQRWKGEREMGREERDGRKRGFDQKKRKYRERERERVTASVFIGFKTLAMIRIFSV